MTTKGIINRRQELNMKRIAQGIAAAAAVTLALACIDTTSPTSEEALALSQAFATLPAGFTFTTNSFAANDNVGDAFLPRMNGEGRGPGGGHHGGGGGLDKIDGHGMMGGLGPDFFGGIGFGRGFGHGPFGGIELRGTCAFNSGTGRVECTDARGGLTIVASASYKTASGTVQQAPDSTTDAVNIQTSVAGTVTRRDSAVSTINHTSNRTVTGLSSSATQRTVNGAARGEESTSGKTDSGVVFTASRLVGDTTTGLVIPIVSGKPTYPTAGKVVRQMKATVTLAGASPATRERREVITYDGSDTATLVITNDGTTKTCKLPLPRGVPSCS
jgi:hypothetical protein